MTYVASLSEWLENFAPLRTAESWDNVGLLWGDAASEVKRVMTCLTVTRATADEAIREHANLIVAHHPVLFRPVQKITADRRDNGFLWDLAKANIAIYSPHTALDNAKGGINDGLARRLGLVDVTALRPGLPRETNKVVVFVPKTDHEAILNAAFDAGAGTIGLYEQCSYSAEGTGTFFGTGKTHPAVGERGRREHVAELKVEFVCPGERLHHVLAAIRKAHSYEVPAIDVLALKTEPEGPGIGRVGRLPNPTTLSRFVSEAQTALGTSPIPFAGDPERPIERVAIGCGAGDDFLGDARQAKADALFTGEARFHRALEAEASGIALVLAGHYATERPGVEDLAETLADAFPDLTIWASRKERDPLSLIKTT